MKFFLLKLARVVRRRQFTPLDMPTSVINKVNAIGKRTKQEVYGSNLEFLNRVKEEYEWSCEDDMDDMLGDAPPEPADFPSISLATGEQMDSRAIEPDVQTEHEFILASADNRPTAFAEPRGNFDVLPNALTTGAHHEESLELDSSQDEHLNEELEAAVLSGEQTDDGSTAPDAQPDEPDDAPQNEPGPTEPEALGRGRRVRKQTRSFDPSASKDGRYTYPDAGEQKIYVQAGKQESALKLTPAELERINELKWSDVKNSRSKRKRLRPKQPVLTANRFAPLSSCDDDHDDVTVKTGNRLSDRIAGSEFQVVPEDTAVEIQIEPEEVATSCASPPLSKLSKNERQKRWRRRQKPKKTEDADLILLNQQAEAVKPAREEHKRRKANKKKAEKRKRK